MCSSLRLATTPYSKKKGRARNGNQISVIPNPYTFHYILTPKMGKILGELVQKLLLELGPSGWGEVDG